MTTRLPPLKGLERLPRALIGEIFSEFALDDLRAVMCVSRRMREFAKEGIAHTSTKVKEFIKITINNLDKSHFAEQIISIQVIYLKCVKFKDTTPRTMRTDILETKQQLIEVIKTLDFQTIRNLKLQLTKFPLFMGGIFELSIIEKRIEKVNRIKSKSRKNDVFCHIIQELINMGNVERAIGIAYSSNFNLRQAIVKLLDIGNIHGAIDLDKNILEEREKDSIFHNIVLTLIWKQNIDKAIEVGRMISAENLRADALECIVCGLIEAGKIYTALDIAMQISSYEGNHCRDSAFVKIAQEFSRRRNVDGAIDAIKVIVGNRESALSKICLTISQEKIAVLSKVSAFSAKQIEPSQKATVLSQTIALLAEIEPLQIKLSEGFFLSDEEFSEKLTFLSQTIALLAEIELLIK